MIFKCQAFLLILFSFTTLIAQNCPDCFPTSGISFSQVGPVGGGFPNVVTWDPNVPGQIYFGSDVGGTGKSTNFGRDFVSTARGLGFQTSHDKIAALNAVDINGSTVIVGGTGFRGGGGEVISSTDGGETWNHGSQDISFSAQNSASPLPTTRPRSTDPSLIQWISDTTWVAGTYDKGIWMSIDDRKKWNRIDTFLGAVHVRAMVKSPNNPNAFYVGLWGDHPSIENKGLYEITLTQSNNGSFEFERSEKVDGIPDVVESIVALGSRLYIACGRFGVRSYVPSNGSINDITGPIGTSVMSTAIHGVEGSFNTDRIVLGTAEGRGDIWLSNDSGSTWENTTDTGVSAVPWGGNEELLVFQTHGSWQLGRNNCDVASIQVSPHDPDAWVVCSTSSIWTTVDAGQNWQPANGFQILTFRDVDVSQSGTIAVGNVDHDALVSTNGGDDWTSIGFGDVSVSHAVEFSPDGTELAFSNNERDNNNTNARSGVASSPNTPSSPNLFELGSTGTKRITGIAWVSLPSGTQRLIASVDDGGIRTSDRPSGSTIWSNWQVRTTEFMGLQSNDGLRTAVATDGESTTFMYDRKTGLWRSTNWGVDWTNILPTSAGPDQGYLAYDEANDKLYIATPNQVLRIDDATTSTATVPLSFPQSNPGAMALDPCGGLIVFANSLGISNPETKLFRNHNPSDGGNWLDIADETFKRIAPLVVDIAISNDRIVMPTRGKGILISETLEFGDSSPIAFTPDPDKRYYIDAPHLDLRLAATGESEDPYTTSTETTGDDVEWKFVDKGNGYWHVQLAVDATLPRLRSDNTSYADMQTTDTNGTFTYYEFIQGAICETYFMTLPDGPSNHKRLQVTNTGEVKFVDITNAGLNESFVFTEVEEEQAQFFTPDPCKKYYLDVPAHNLRLAATGESEDAYTTSTNTTGADVEWQFVEKGNGYWHLDRAAGGTKPRLRTDNTIIADMQETSSDGNFTYYDITEGQSPGSYFLTLPDGPIDFSRLQIHPEGEVNMVGSNSAGTWESFIITEVNAPSTLVHITKRNAPGFAIDGNTGGANGQNIILFEQDAGHVNQQWLEIELCDGYYLYQKQGTTVCIDGGNGGANNQNVFLSTCDETDQNQQWQKVATDGGAYQLVKRNAIAYAIHGGSGGVNGRNIDLYDSSNPSHNLQWFITNIDNTQDCLDTRILEGNISRVDHYRARLSIQSTQTLTDGAEVIYDAAEEVSLNVTFEVTSGTTFEVILEGCGND